jgi:hypothetical protein
MSANLGIMYLYIPWYSKAYELGNLELEMAILLYSCFATFSEVTTSSLPYLFA